MAGGRCARARRRYASFRAGEMSPGRTRMRVARFTVIASLLVVAGARMACAQVPASGAPVDQRGRSIFLERFIHGEIYKARPDVNAVIHSHSPGVIPFGITNVPLRPVFHTAAF